MIDSRIPLPTGPDRDSPPAGQRTFRVAGLAFPLTALGCGLCGRRGPFAITRISAPGDPPRFAGPCCTSSHPSGGEDGAAQRRQERGTSSPPSGGEDGAAQRRQERGESKRVTNASTASPAPAAPTHRLSRGRP